MNLPGIIMIRLTHQLGVNFVVVEQILLNLMTLIVDLRSYMIASLKLLYEEGKKHSNRVLDPHLLS